MKTQLTTLDNGSRTREMTEPVSGRKPVLALLMRLLWAAALVLPVFGGQAAVVFTTLYSFTDINNGEHPQAGLVQGSDGNFYGTTYGHWEGYGPDYGTVFKISPNGALTTLHSFTGTNDGANPQAALVQGNDGNFYGTTVWGGNPGYGTVFKISTNGALTILHSFDYYNDGAYPAAGLVQGSDGNFYGTAEGGGTNGYGTVFQISTNGALTTLYSFFGGPDGILPSAGLVQGNDGNFYGTTLCNADYFGDYAGGGTVFKISTNGALSTLYSFGSVQDDGGRPTEALVQGSDGNFYGTTEIYGTYGYGTVFKISTNGTYASLYSFTGTNDGCFPNGLVQGSDGNLYGTTQSGGNMQSNGGNGSGTVFRITTNEALTTLYSLGGNDGTSPSGALVQGSDGSFYGTTYGDMWHTNGTVFRLTIVPDPQLSIIPSGPYVILTWPTNHGAFSYAGYTLQSTTNLGSSALWTPVSPKPVVIGGENVVINTMSGRQQFYRLSQ